MTYTPQQVKEINEFARVNPEIRDTVRKWTECDAFAFTTREFKIQEYYRVMSLAMRFSERDLKQLLSEISV